MFARFTERARQVVVLAQDEARSLKHDHIGTEHLLLGLMLELEGIAAEVLDSFSVDLEHVRERLVAMVAPGEGIPRGQIPFTPRAKRVLEHALRESLERGDGFIGTEHILIAVTHEPDSVAGRILKALGAPLGTVRDETTRRMSKARPDVVKPVPTLRRDPLPDWLLHMPIGAVSDRVRAAKEQAITANELERAAALRDLERTLKEIVESVTAQFPEGL